MAQRIQISDDFTLAFGLAWIAIDPLTSRGEQIRPLQEQGARWQAAFTQDGNESFGYSSADLKPVKGDRTKLLSGAGQVALHPSVRGKTALVLLEDMIYAGGQGDVAVVGLIGGSVVVDAFVPLAEVNGVIEAFEERCAKAKREFTIYGDTQANDLQVDEVLPWHELAPQRTGKKLSLKRGEKLVYIKPLRPAMPNWVPYAVSAGALAVIGYWGYGQYTEMQLKAARAKQAQQQDPRKLYADSSAQLLAQPVLRANTAFRELRAAIAGMQTNLVGWSLSSVVCGEQGTCSATWTQKTGTYKEFVAAAPAEWGVIGLDNDGTKATHNIPLKMTLHPLPPRDQWTDERNFQIEHLSQWQKYWVMQFTPKLGKAAQVVGLPPGMDEVTASQFPEAIWATTWDVQGGDWFMSEAFDTTDAARDQRPLPDEVTVKGITIHFNEKSIKFDAGGQVYVRK